MGGPQDPRAMTAYFGDIVSIAKKGNVGDPQAKSRL